MKTYYQNTCLGCDLLHNKVCPHYKKNNYPGHYNNVCPPLILKHQLYSHQYVELRNGMYEGTMSNFKREGFGIFNSDEGFICIGNWLEDYLDGESIIFFFNGGYLYANFNNNKINGLGILKRKNSSLIGGVWKDNNLEGIAFHHYPQKCLWVQCEYRQGEFIRYIKEERYGSNVDSLNYMKEDNLNEIKLPEMLNQYPDIKNLILSFYAKNCLENIIKGMKINVRGQFSDFKMISLLNIKKGFHYLGYAENDERPNGLGVMYDDELNIITCGNFKGGYQDGLVRVNYDNGDIYEGVIKKKEYQVGVLYTFLTNTFEFGAFKDNICSRIYQGGKGFPSELIKKFKSILHKKVLKFSDKYFDLTQIYNKNSSFNLFTNSFEESKNDETKINFDKLTKIELSPASFLEEEKLLRRNIVTDKKFNRNPKIDDSYVNLIQLNDSKQNIITNRYNNINKTPQKIKFKENTELFPLNISQYPLKEDQTFFKYQKNFYDFYDKNIETYTVSSQNNDINEYFKNHSKNHYLDSNKEIVNLCRKNSENIKHHNNKILKKNPSTFVTYFYEEQNPNNPKKPSNIDEVNPFKNSYYKEDPMNNFKNSHYEDSPLKKSLGPNKRSISLAPPLKKDTNTSDDLREIFESSYMISLESDKEFQSIMTKFYENPKNIDEKSKNKNKPYPLYKNHSDIKQKPNLLNKSPDNNMSPNGKRNYMIYSINDPNHFKNKNNHIIDCLVYDFDHNKSMMDEQDFTKKNKKKIFDPI